MAKKPRTKPARPKVADPDVRQVASQPSARSAILWSPAHLRQVMQLADGGELMMLADMCEQIIADDRIGELLETLAGDVLGSDLTFEKTPLGTVGDAEKAEELEADWTLGYDDDELTSLAIWTLTVGVGFAKHEQWIDHDGRLVPRLKHWHSRHFAWSHPLNSRNTHDRQWHWRNHDGQMTPFMPGDGTWVVLTRRGEYRPWSTGLWRGLAPWWLLKQFAMSDWGVHSEKASKLVVTADDSSTSEQRKAIAKYIYEANKDAVVALPVGFDMKLIELSANTREIYDAQIQAANEAASITILGQNLTSNVTGGSRAAAEVHERKENRKVRNVGKMLTKGLHDQSISWWAEFNFGDRDLAPYPHWHTEPPEDYAAKAAGLKTLGEAVVALKTAGYKLSAETLEEEYGVELEECEPLGPKAAVPGQEPGQGPAKSGAPKPGAKPPAAAPKPKAQKFLASGADPATVPGFVRGQVYVDDVSDKATALAADYLSAFVDRIANAIEGAEDYEAVRGAVLQAFADEEDPERLVELIEHGMLLANLAGRHAVNEDLESEGAT